MPKPQRLNPLDTQQEIVISTTLGLEGTTALAPQVELLYDYSQIEDPQAAASAQQAARRIKQRSQRIGSDMLDIGQALTTAKAIIPHGQWLPWLQTEFKINPKGAERLMTAYETFKDRRAEAAFFNSSVLAIMSGHNFPEAARQDLIAQAQATGHSPTVTDAAAANKQHKTAPNSTTLSNLKNTHTGDASKMLTEPSESAAKPPLSPPIAQPAHVVEPTNPTTPTWQLIHLINQWLTERLDGKTSPNYALALISNLRARIQPTWTQFTSALAAQQIIYLDSDLHTALLDIEARLRAAATNNPTPPVRFLSAAETSQLILHVIAGDSDAGDTAARHASLRRLSALRDYLPALPNGVTLSNKVFQQSYAQIEQALWATLFGPPNPQQPPAELTQTAADPVVTVQLHPDTAVILAHALRSRSFDNLHQTVIEEILHALGGN